MLHDIITIAVLLYFVVAFVVWSMAGSEAAADMEAMRNETEMFNTAARNAGHLIPPQAPLSVAYQNIFWQGIVWPAYFAAKRKK